MKAVIFDCFGVLTTERWLEFLAGLPKGVDVDQVRSVHHAYTTGMISQQVCAQQIYDLSGQRFAESEDKGEATKNTALLGYIRELRVRGYKIGILSNIGTTWITDTFLTKEEQKLFDGMVLSFEAGMIKPDPRIFMLVCERLGVDPEQALLVDDIDRYCMAAQSVGMQAIVYKNFKQVKSEIEKILAAQQNDSAG